MELAQIEKYLLLPLTKLKTAEWNYKQNSDELTAKLIANMKRNGQVENLLVRELSGGLYEVVNGNHRKEALEKSGCKHAVCYNLGKIADEEAYRISIETNETKFAVDQIQLAKLIKSISDTVPIEELVASFPYSQDEVENYLKMNTFDWDNFTKKAEQNDATQQQQQSTLELSFTLEGKELSNWNEWKSICLEKQPDPAPTPEQIFASAITLALSKSN